MTLLCGGVPWYPLYTGGCCVFSVSAAVVAPWPGLPLCVVTALLLLTLTLLWHEEGAEEETALLCPLFSRGLASTLSFGSIWLFSSSRSMSPFFLHY